MTGYRLGHHTLHLEFIFADNSEVDRYGIRWNLATEIDCVDYEDRNAMA